LAHRDGTALAVAGYPGEMVDLLLGDIDPVAHHDLRFDRTLTSPKSPKIRIVLHDHGSYRRSRDF
jgi:hypothetical protein